MIIDSSALVAVLLAEAERTQFLEVLVTASRRSISAANYLEAAIVFDRRIQGEIADRLSSIMEVMKIGIEPVTAEQVRIARDAYRRYGRGNHPGSLNFGDCFAYALAKETGRPLLFKGTDFAQTDITPALAK